MLELLGILPGGAGGGTMIVLLGTLPGGGGGGALTIEKNIISIQ
jgi:hypothetical protein